MRLSGSWPTISGRALSFLVETSKGASLTGCYYVNGLPRADGLKTIAIVALGQELESKQYYGNESETYPGGELQATQYQKRGFSSCNVAGNIQTHRVLCGSSTG